MGRLTADVVWAKLKALSDGAAFGRPGRGFVRLNFATSRQILNEALAATSGRIIVFLNSDATPTDDRWLERLIRPFSDPTTGAVFGRQQARTDCRSLFVKDTERAFGDGTISSKWVHFFSMAGIPVSTSQAVVGGVIGVGLTKGMRAVSFRKISTIFIGWVVTPLSAAIFAALAYKLIA